MRSISTNYPFFIKKYILVSFNELKTLYGYDQSQGIVLFNNKDILVGGKPVYINEWFKKGAVFIKDLLKNDGNFLTFKEFSDKYGCQTNFLQYYQITSAIPNRLLTKAKDTATFNKLYFTSNNKIFNLNDTVKINLGKAKSKDFYKLLNDKTHTDNQTGAKRRSKSLSLNEDSWCRSLKNVYKENKLRVSLQVHTMHLLAEWEGRAGKYLARGTRHDQEANIFPSGPT